MNLGTKVNLTLRPLKTGPLIKTSSENKRVSRLPKKRIQPSLVGVPYLSLACKGDHIMCPHNPTKESPLLPLAPATSACLCFPSLFCCVLLCK